MKKILVLATAILAGVAIACFHAAVSNVFSLPIGRQVSPALHSCLHEAAHALLALREGCELYAVQCNEIGGVASYFAGPGVSLEGQARAVLAGGVAAGEGASDDLRQAKFLQAVARGGPTWIAERRAEVREYLDRPEVKALLERLSILLEDAPDNSLTGPQVERIVAGGRP